MEFDLTTLPGHFNVAKSTNWEKGNVVGTTLKPNGGNPGAVGYSYDCGQGKTVHFHLNVSYTHTHAYDGTWKQDASKHWKECTDATCPDKSGSVKDSAAHVYDNDADTDCNICGYVRTVTVPHTHTYDATWKQDASKHWKECTDAACPDKSGSVKDSAAHVYDNDADTDCNICGYVRTVTVPHTHTYDATWKQDASKHWKECTDAACPDKNGSVKDSAAHTYDSNGTCTTCGYKKPSSGGSSSGGSSGGGSSSGGSSGGGSSSGGSSGGHHSSSGGGGGSSRRSGSGSSTTPKTLAGSWKQNQNGWWYQYTNGTWPSNSWVKLPVQGGEAWYYFNKDGYMATGWLFENNNWYYLDPQTGTNNGRMMTGWHMISDKWYYFSTDKLAGEGSMYADRMTPDGFYVNKDGVWVQ